ncbi:unnamed protein product [Adineta steineri]|uniref:Fatty acid desaturase domain-containing protein n=1 Tax=Adineta steineri TaxID=433720 RepID=A0A814WYJ9_9BILA|nr:unnamed protein product [Adineta steineri]CAF1207165.1 unnamed protein product [Adineta steineri]CAF3676049.1 unnamed protein product [Adineta steineri]CAF3903738.1 unnamed protein product [Adineta steineri]
MSNGSPLIQRNAHTVSVSREICRAIKENNIELRRKYPFLFHQDCIGGMIFGGSILLISLFIYLYLSNYISAISTTILIGIAISFLHELEHDIIHNLCFKQQRWIQNFMFVFMWIAKLHVSPWFRRQEHLKHHLLSGQTNDVEERLIGLGLKPNRKRMAVSMHPYGSVLVGDDVARDAQHFNLHGLLTTTAPAALVFLFITRLFIAYNLLFMIYSYFNYDIVTIFGFHTFYPIIRTLAVCLTLPNLIRQSSLILMSNCCHYYGDIPLNNVYYQNQILDSWYVFPFQLFCFNFGATHIVHHYVPSQPFYIRHFTARAIKDMMINLGVRHNDFGILWRSNRYSVDPKEDNKQRFYGKCWFVVCLLLGVPLFIVWDVMVMHKLNKSILKLMKKKYSNSSLKEMDDSDDKAFSSDSNKFDSNDTVNNSALTNLNALVNKIVLNDVSADQVDEISKTAVET